MHPQSNLQPRAALYCRVSTPGQEADGTSLETQEDRCRAYGAEHGYVLDEAHVYRDVHSGYELKERPALSRLREAMQRGAVDVVVAYALDRLSREQNQQGALVYEADDAGVRLEFVTEDFENSATGKFMRSARAFVAEIEREKIIERTVRGRRARVQGGKPLAAGRPLYGYQWRDAEKSGYRIDPTTAAVVRRIFQRNAEGAPIRAIAAELSAAGIPSPAGKPTWNGQGVRFILKHPFYAGRAAGWRNQVVKSRVNGVTTTRLVLRPEDEQIPLPEGTVPPIVDADTFAAAQARLVANKARATRNNHHPEATLLRGGFARCGLCGYAMRAEFTMGRWRYRCSNRAERGNCTTPSIRADTLDAAVWDYVSEILNNPEIIAAELDQLQKDDPTAADLELIDRALTDAARRQSNYVGNLADLPTNAAALVRARIADLESQQLRLQGERNAILERRAGWLVAQEQLADLEAWCRVVAQRLSAPTYSQKRMALEALAVEARVFRPRQEPRFVITAQLPLYSSSTPRDASSSRSASSPSFASNRT
jgi:site-specific DNA recombinase